MSYIRRPACHPEPDAVDFGNDVFTLFDQRDGPDQILSLDADALARGIASRLF